MRGTNPNQYFLAINKQVGNTTRNTRLQTYKSMSTGHYTSRGNDHPVQSMVFSWVFCILFPAAALAWSSTKRVTVVFGATLATPALAILQGAIGILYYRVYFGDAPLPQTPSHGVVVVHPDHPAQSQQQEGNYSDDGAATTTPQSLRKLSPRHTTTRPLAGLPILSLGCECNSTSNGPESTSPCRQQNDAFLHQTIQEPPLRLLVVGDSLAIGVGQAKSCTPIMPETIAKTLSKQLGGRVVYWTCHGAPGASTGWIVREIERGVTYLCNEQQQQQQADEENGTELESLPSKMDVSWNCSDTDESSSSSSDESSSAGDTAASQQQDHFVKSGMVRGDSLESTDGSEGQHHKMGGISLSQWKERLSQHRQRFDHPEVLGPYDVVVVVTGSNDLKSAFFPFLLTGEDAEFRRQAKARGGSYTKELRRLVETLKVKTQRRIQNIVHSVEVATESVREKVGETMEYIAPGSSSRLQSPRSGRSLHQEDEASTDRLIDYAHQENDSSERRDSRHLPLVVLPGMPSRALPIFKRAPLRWLSVSHCGYYGYAQTKLCQGTPWRSSICAASIYKGFDRVRPEKWRVV